MYDEMKFLFDIDPYIKNSNNDTNKNQIVNAKNPAQSVEYRTEYDDKKGIFNDVQYVLNKTAAKNYISSDVNKFYNTTNSNPYLEMLKYFNQSGVAKSLRIKSSDLAYLRDIGVMPINRLMILRRFEEGYVVPNDLSTFPYEPISIVIGWVKKDTNLLNFSFNEKWQRQGSGDQLHLMLNKIVKDEFGVDISSLIPVPGWGLGFLFQILNNMGITTYDITNVPIGNPNLLKESITRPHEEFGLESSFSFELETVYEQKYIAGIDSTVAIMEIIKNLLVMGTSDVEFLGKGGGKYLKQLSDAANDPTSGSKWLNLIEGMVKGFVDAIGSTITTVKEDLASLIDAKKNTGINNNTGNNTNGTNPDTNKTNTDSKDKQGIDIINAFTGSLSAVMETKTFKSILASTVARYQWPLRGSIAMFTGQPSTPWHLTIGNPFAPLLSMNNIYVKSVQVNTGKDMAYNDIPRTLEVKISIEQGRNLGKQEIYQLFGINYKRQYAKTK